MSETISEKMADKLLENTQFTVIPNDFNVITEEERKNHIFVNKEKWKSAGLIEESALEKALEIIEKENVIFRKQGRGYVMYHKTDVYRIRDYFLQAIKELQDKLDD